MTAAFVNDARAISVRLFIPWRGTWLADVDLDPDDAKTFPTSGPATLRIGDAATLVGTIDPRNSGRFASSVRVRIAGGAGGWDSAPLLPRYFASDSGVSSRDVYEATANEIGEQVNDPFPISFGLYYTRSGGPASRVFGDRDYYVDLAGITQVGSRPSATPDKTLEVLNFEPQAQRLELAADVVILPGTMITDARFDGQLVVRDVEQTFDTNGSRATAWCSSAAATRLAGGLAHMVREFAGVTYLRLYAYRFINDGSGSGRLNLQAVNKGPGLPDGIPIPVFPGMAGLSAKLTASQTVLVAFLEGDPKQPVVVGFDGNLPSEVTIDATDKVNLGGEGGAGAAAEGSAVAVYLPAGTAITGTVGGAPLVATLTSATPLLGVVLSGSEKVRVVT
jgi:hypothetical protein